MPLELIADQPGHAVLQAYEEPPLKPDQVRIRSLFSSVTHGTGFRGFRADSADASDRGVDFLSEGTSPEAWIRRGIVWRFGRLEADYAPRLLARFAVMGLSVSSDPRSAAHLRKLLNEPTSRRTPDGAAGLAADQIREALARLEGEKAAEQESPLIRVP